MVLEHLSLHSNADDTLPMFVLVKDIFYIDTDGEYNDI